MARPRRRQQPITSTVRDWRDVRIPVTGVGQLLPVTSEMAAPKRPLLRMLRNRVAKPVGFGDHHRLAIAGRNQFMEDGNSNVTPQVPLSDNAGVTNFAPTANDTNAGPMDASPKTQEEAVPMLDVHAPHEVVHTWKAFFIHIATIVVGLLIAIGLEQAVEYFHHRHQAREMAEMLRQESSKNRDVAKFDLERADQIIRAIETNMESLKSVRNSASKSTFTPNTLPHGQFFMPSDAAWVTMRDSALLPIIPPTLVGNYWKIETTIQGLEERYQVSQ